MLADAILWTMVATSHPRCSTTHTPQHIVGATICIAAMPHLKKYLGPPWASTARPALIMVGRDAAVHIIFVLITSSGVVAAAAKAPAQAPIAKSSCTCSKWLLCCMKMIQTCRTAANARLVWSLRGKAQCQAAAAQMCAARNYTGLLVQTLI